MITIFSLPQKKAGCPAKRRFKRKTPIMSCAGPDICLARRSLCPSTARLLQFAFGTLSSLFALTYRSEINPGSQDQPRRSLRDAVLTNLARSVATTPPSSTKRASRAFARGRRGIFLVKLFSTTSRTPGINLIRKWKISLVKCIVLRIA